MKFYPKSRIFDLVFHGFSLYPDCCWLMLFSEIPETGGTAGCDFSFVEVVFECPRSLSNWIYMTD